ncbi:MAG: hypothetical protein V1734_02605 [Nanoarchaeota archaeon]
MNNFEKMAMEALFWVGFALILVPIFYREMMLLTILVSFGLMFFTVAMEGFSLAKGKTALETIKKNEISLLHKCLGIIALFLAALYIYTDGDLIYNSLQNFMAWLVSSTSVSALALITLGALFAFLALFQPSKKFLRKMGLFRKKQKSRISKKSLRKRWKAIAHSFRNLSFANKGKKKKHNKKNIPHSMAFADKFLAILFIFVITAILVLNKKGMFSAQNHVHLGILITIFILFAIAVGFSAHSKKPVSKTKQEPEKEHEPGQEQAGIPLEKLKLKAIAKAGKYQTDIDRLYRAINSSNMITITRAAAMFKISKEQAEEWGKILENHGLIELRYPAIGELQLCKKKLKTTE